MIGGGFETLAYSVMYYPLSGIFFCFGVFFFSLILICFVFRENLADF